MRNKIKQLMNKEEGFTLVELLAVIVILGIIVAIAIPSVGGIINRAQTNADAAEQSLVIDAARVYFTAEQPSTDTVTVTALEAGGYLEDRDVDGTEIPRATVTRTQDSTTKTYSYSYALGE